LSFVVLLSSLCNGVVSWEHPMAGHRREWEFVEQETPKKCRVGTCAGLAKYPIKPNRVHFSAEFTVPDEPEQTDDITFFIYYNIFFGNGPKSNTTDYGMMNQFVPQLMLGNPLCDSTGPPLYKPLWRFQPHWVFGSQYFFEIFNATEQKMQSKAATGELHKAYTNETIWTSFELSDDWTWTLGMGVKGDETRESYVVTKQPFMGLVPGSTSWSEQYYDKTFVCSCWELYGKFGADDYDKKHYPKNGSKYKMLTRTDDPGFIKWDTHWTESESSNCSYGPDGSNIVESHTDSEQTILWDIVMKKH